jgi:hypothetical protein
MESIVAILRAAHCKSTHHYFAIDALFEVATKPGQELANLLLANYSQYLQGAKDPDNVFKDFENHVLHVRDGYWGGAAKACQKWLTECYKRMQANQWPEAAYAIGVLSHYFSDPFMPLHTAQSPRETIVHRPLEWSVCCAYSEIYETACHDAQLESFALEPRADWVQDGVMRGATMVNKYYEPLMDDYDMNESRRNPKLALGSDSKRILSQLFTWVLTGWGNALDRIAIEFDKPIPQASLALPTLLAGIQVPMKKVVAAIESNEQRREVENILDEYQRTGKVVRNLTPEQRTVQKVRVTKPDLHPPAKDIERVVASVQAANARPMPLVSPPPSVPTNQSDKANPTQSIVQPPMPAIIKPTPRPSTHSNEIVIKKPTIAASVSFPRKAIPHSQSSAPRVQQNPARATLETTPRQRARLTSISPIVDAPAIGPKTAARFIDAGYQTVGHLLQGDPERIATQLDTKWITPKLVSQWQDQARMACQIERLTAAGSGLLIMAGIRTVEDLLQHNAEQIYAMIDEVAQSAEGKRLLREQPPPPINKIQEWLDCVQAGQGRGAA